MNNMYVFMEKFLLLSHKICLFYSQLNLDFKNVGIFDGIQYVDKYKIYLLSIS